MTESIHIVVLMIRNICLETWVRYYTGCEKEKNNSVKKNTLVKKVTVY